MKIHYTIKKAPIDYEITNTSHNLLGGEPFLFSSMKGLWTIEDLKAMGDHLIITPIYED